MNICALTEIRTRDPNNPAVAELRLRPHGHSDRQCYGSSSKIHTYSDTEGTVVLPPLIFVAVYMH